MIGRRVHRSLKFGGINPPPYKAATLRSRIMPTPLPECLVLPLHQHQGSAPDACVKVGERVLKYQLLASGDRDLSLNLHAPTSGTITAIDLQLDYFGTGAAQQAITLEPDGKDEIVDGIECSSPRITGQVRNHFPH